MVIEIIFNEIEWLSFQLILGICISAIGAHPSLCNLSLKDSLTIGFFSGFFSNIVFLYGKILLGPKDIVSQGIGIISLLIMGVILVSWRFFRDPKRDPPDIPSAILSPADGKIIKIREVNKGMIICPIKGKTHIKLNEISKTNFLKDNDGYLVEINMSLLDVHVNRAPISGSVTFIKYTPGKFFSLKHWKSEIENPRNTIIIENNDFSALLVQIGSKRISSIRCFLKEGDSVMQGERIGKITLGSQVDIAIPKRANLKFLVNEGDRVIAGETVIAVFE